MEILDPENFKLNGNTHFKEKRYEEAIESFTMAIEESLKIKDFNQTQIAIYYSNRALVYLTLKKYDNVLFDSIKSLKYDNNWLKAKYFKALAYFKLGNSKKALDLIEETMKDSKIGTEQTEFVNLLKEIKEQNRNIIEKKDNLKDSTDLYALYSYYNYRKEYFFEFIGLFTDENIAKSKMNNYIRKKLKEEYSWKNNPKLIQKGDLIGAELGCEDEEEWVIFRTQKLMAKGINIQSPVFINIEYECKIWGSFNSEPLGKVVGLSNDISMCFEKPKKDEMIIYPRFSKSEYKNRIAKASFEIIVNK